MIRFSLVLLLVLPLTGCANRPKGDILDVRELPSPDGRHICTVYGETFYNTTGYARHIVIHPAEHKRGYPGNVYLVPVGTSLSVVWTSPTNLFVSLNFESPHAAIPSTNVAGVEVTFSVTTKYPVTQ